MIGVFGLSSWVMWSTACDAAPGLNMLNTTNLDYFAAHHQVTLLCNAGCVRHLANPPKCPIATLKFAPDIVYICFCLLCHVQTCNQAGLKIATAS